MQQLLDSHLECGLGCFDANKFNKYFKNQLPPNFERSPTQRFRDPYFPPDSNSLIGKDINGNWVDEELGPKKSQNFDYSKIEWKCASELFSKYLLFDEKIEFSDIKQGSLGNCYFLSAIAALTEFPHLIYQIFRTKEVSPNGYYEIVLFIDGEWQVVFVDDYVPVQKGTKNFTFARPNGNELWVILLEKAWAKVNGGYVNTIAGWPSDPLVALTGFACETVRHCEMKEDDLWSHLRNCDDMNNILCSSTKNDPETDQYGLVTNHAYTLIGAKEYNQKGLRLRLLKIRNPWGFKEWNGDWSDKSVKWTKELKKYFDSKDINDGAFFIELKDFIRFFQITHICHIIYDANIKSFKFQDTNQLRQAHVFNVLVEQENIFSFSLIFKHWRYNRKLLNVIHPASILIAEYDTSLKMHNIVGTFAGYENAEHVKKLKPGSYVVWVYSPYQYCKSPRPDQYIFRLYSNDHFKYRYVGTDNSFDFVREMLISGVKETYSKEIESKKDEQFINTQNSFKRSGLGFRAVVNNSPTVYQKFENNTSNIQNMFLLPPNEGKEKADFMVPPMGTGIIVGMRTEQWGQYWFNLQTSYTTYPCNVGEQPVDVKKPDLNIYLNTDLHQDDLNDTYYDYHSTTIEESKKQMKFNSININEIKMDLLRKENPELLDLILSMEPLKSNQEYIWGKLLYENGFYLGEFITKDTQKVREGRGAYYWNNDGSLFVGYWKDSLKEKKGTVYDKNRQIIYQGEFSRNKKNGIGRFFFNSGDMYIGGYENDMRHGKGKYVWSDGSSWEGLFRNNQMHGVGIYSSSDGETWEVEYNNGQLV